MNVGRLRWLAWGPLALYASLAISGLTLEAITGTSFGDIGLPITALALFYGLFGLMVALGVLIVLRHPRHPVGWIMSLGFVTPAIDQFATGYVAYGLAPSHSPLPGAKAAMLWLNSSGMPWGMYFLVLIFLLSPDGKFLSKGWSRLAWIALAALVGYLAVKAFEPGPLVLFPSLNNPFGVGARAWTILGSVMWLAMGTLFLCVVAAPLSLLVRVRRGPPEVRQQVQWLLPFAGLFAVGVPITLLGEHGPVRALFGFGGMLHMVAVSGLVLATVFGVFKYRLYDLDLIIQRTLVYTVLTGALGVTYYAGIAILQPIFPERSQVTTVLTTLAIAALFSPLRRRIQRVIDRRFFRRKYDAAQALAAFSATARDEVDLEALTAAMISVVRNTMQPAHISLWLVDKAKPHGS
jgi:hypothetical protein